MNGVNRILIGTALLLAVAGGLVVVAAASGNMDMKGMSYDMKRFEVGDAFSDIRIEDAECSVRILRATDGECRVVCPEKRDGSIYHTVAVSDGVLCVQRHDSRKWYQYIGISLGAPEVAVYLPERAYGELALQTVSGDIQVDDGFTFESARLLSTSGSIRMLSDAQKALHANSTSGRITVENAAPEALAAESVSGRVVLSHIRSGEISARTTSGRIELTDAIAEGGLYARSVSGGVALDGCDGGDIRIETTSGSVKGTLLSDKMFTADSTSGSVKVPRSAAGGACEISTTSGSIAIEIRQ